MSGYPDEDPDAAPPRRRADLSLPRKVTMDPMQYYGRCELQARASEYTPDALSAFDGRPRAFSPSHTWLRRTHWPDRQSPETLIRCRDEKMYSCLALGL